jgi:hypothetical protein
MTVNSWCIVAGEVARSTQENTYLAQRAISCRLLPGLIPYVPWQCAANKHLIAIHLKYHACVFMLGIFSCDRRLVTLMYRGITAIES